jgi:hypothetical protein
MLRDYERGLGVVKASALNHSVRVNLFDCNYPRRPASVILVANH